MSHLGIVLKTSERCNINCDYCYFFFGGDESWKKHPAYIKSETLSAVASFLVQGVHEMKIDTLTIGLHGGEPLLQKKNLFDAMCNEFKSQLSHITSLGFTLQTNATLIDEEWIELFEKHNVAVGVSLDGPKIYNDAHRLDKKGHSTYEKVIRGIKLLQKAESQNKIPPIGLLCVIDPSNDPKKIYRHFVDDLGLKNMDFLLPDTTHDGNLPFGPEVYGNYLCSLFDEWSEDNDPEISVRYLKTAIDTFLGRSSSIYGIGKNDSAELPLLTISSNGELSPVDELRVTDDEIMHTDCNVENHTLTELLNRPVFQKISQSMDNLAIDCQNCCWANVCGGGSLVSRFSRKNSFDNSSIFCEGLKDFYSHVAAYMVRNGYPSERLMENLGLHAA